MRKLSGGLTLFLAAAVLALGQYPVVTPSAASKQSPEPFPKPLPPYAVYRHFLSWVNQLDRSAMAAGTGDPYQFAEAFGRANLAHQHLDILREAAHQLDSDLHQHEARAQSVIKLYRIEATNALAQGQPMPPAPPEIRSLERERTAILIDRYVKVRMALGPDIAAQLDGYLNYEFTPHIKLRPVTTPTAPVQVTPGN